ncbi:MAG: T9SS type A sorting domain-containing protein [Flavipsychrobacter sp.]
MRRIYLAFVFLTIGLSAAAQTFHKIQWQKSLGGSKGDQANDIQQTSDGGYIMIGTTTSIDGDISGALGASGTNIWVVKLNGRGAISWQKVLGGTDNDNGASIRQTNDGGYILAATSSSTDGNVTGNHGGSDFWVAKLNSTGTLLWQRSLGGSADDYAAAIRQTKDSGYVVAGFTSSIDGDVTGNHGSYDFWVVKLDDTGAVKWQKALGGTNDDRAAAVEQTADTGYIVTGYTNSMDGDVTSYHGTPGTYSDYWVVKLSKAGSLQWQKSYGGEDYDYASSVKQTKDGGYVVAGFASSNYGDVKISYGDGDMWLLKLNDTGAISWQKSYGGSATDYATSVQQTLDGGYALAGYTASADSDVTHHYSGGTFGYDYWFLKLNDTGAISWQKDLGGTDDDIAYAMQQTADTGFILAGYTLSNDSDVTGYHGNSDCWLVKLHDTTIVRVNVPGLAGNNDLIKVYPTNTTGVVNIELPADYNDAVLHLYNIAGQLASFTEDRVGDKRVIRFDNVLSGLYILQVVSKQNISTFKLLYQP